MSERDATHMHMKQQDLMRVNREDETSSSPLSRKSGYESTTYQSEM
jgi:hypothetical protein